MTGDLPASQPRYPCWELQPCPSEHPSPCGANPAAGVPSLPLLSLRHIRQGTEQLPGNGAAKALDSTVRRKQSSRKAFRLSSVLCQPAAGAGVSRLAKSLSIPKPVFQELIVNGALDWAASVKFGMYAAGFNASLKRHFKCVNSSFFN